jgi:hypothetical protein
MFGRVSWTPIAPSVLEHVRDKGSGWSLRSIAIELPSGGHAVLSAGTGMDPDALSPRFLVCGNHFHWLGIPEWLERFPEARVVATKTAAPRLRAKLGRDVGELSEIDLPKGTTFVEPAGVGSGEIWLDANGAWIVCDAFFNEPNMANGVMGVGLRLSGTTPGLRIGQTWKWMQLSKRAEYKEWLLARLKDAPPKALIPAHGEMAEGADLADRLAALVRERL